MDPDDNVIITGFRNGAVVAESVFSMGFLPSLFAGGQAFSNLDRLMVSTIDDRMVATPATTAVMRPRAKPMMSAMTRGMFMGTSSGRDL